MAFMHVSLVELLRQAVMGWIPALEYMLLGKRVLPQPCPIMPGKKCRRFLKPRCW
jgi:hypothetical protein